MTDFVAYGNDELKDCVPVQKGEMVQCEHCKKSHPLRYGTDPKTGKENDLLVFYKCDRTGESYLAGINGKLLPELTWRRNKNENQE